MMVKGIIYKTPDLDIDALELAKATMPINGYAWGDKNQAQFYYKVEDDKPRINRKK